MEAFSHLLKEIGRGTHGSQSLSFSEAENLFGAMLDGGVPDLELGAILMAFRFKGESVDELGGFLSALSSRINRLQFDSGDVRPIVLPSYNGARRQANLLPLLALLLRNLGIPVLIHGTLGGNGRIASAYILRELGIMPCSSLTETEDRLQRDGIAFAPVSLLAPGLANLLMLRQRLGVRSSAHSLVKLIDPFVTGGLRVVSVSHPAYMSTMHDLLGLMGANALLLRATEGEAFANPKRRPDMTLYQNGEVQTLFEAETGVIKELPNLPAGIDAATTAEWSRKVLAHEVALPSPLANQLACCLYGAGGAADLAQAKAIVAVETGTLLAA